MAILRAQKPDGTYGDLKMDAQGRLLVNNGLDGPQTLLDYPSVGSLDSYVSVVNDEALFYKGAGESGKVSRLQINSPAALDPTAELRIYVDAGDIADLADPPAERLAARIPIQTLLGMRLDTSAPSRIDTAILAFANHSLLAGHPMFELTLPIPYADGCLIQIWQEDELRPVTVDDIVLVSFEEGPLPMWRYSEWRLRSGAFNGTVAYDNSDPYSAESEAIFLNAADGPGMLVSLHASMKSLAAEPTWDYCRNPWELSINGGDRNWRSRRTEDMFVACGQYFQLGVMDTFLGYTWGLTGYGYDLAEWEAYSIFTKTPIVWTDGCVGSWGNRFESTSGDVEAHILALYYAP